MSFVRARPLLIIATISVCLAGTQISDARISRARNTLDIGTAAASPLPRLDRQAIAGLEPLTMPRQSPVPAVAQERSPQERVVREIETRGFSGVSGLMRRGANYVFQAIDPYGEKVRVVMNAETGEIVGLSRVEPKKK